MNNRKNFVSCKSKSTSKEITLSLIEISLSSETFPCPREDNGELFGEILAWDEANNWTQTHI